MNTVSNKVAWINSNIKPFEIGVEPKDESFIYSELDNAFSHLPIELAPFLEYVRNDANLFIGGRTIDRLMIAVLNEDDNRIANFRAKDQVLDILKRIIQSGRAGRLRMRRSIQAVKRWNDDIEPVTGIVTDWNSELQEKLLLLFFICWRISMEARQDIAQQFQSRKTREILLLVLREYGAIALQSTVRGFLGRIHHRQELQRAKDENIKEIQKWSIFILQKVARGYIARKTIVRSMKIRKQLSRDVLRIAEKFMKSGDVWGFLGDINEELERSKKELKDTESREDNWASKFVEKVVTNRQKEFNEAWDRFPAALQEMKHSNTAVGSLIDDHKDLSKSSGLDTVKIAHSSSDNAVSVQEAALVQSTKIKANAATSNGRSSDKRALKKGEVSEDEVVNAMNFTADTHYSNNPNRMPGPLLRKALQTTVKVEVASQLNKIMQTSFHSRKLAQDIISVYGPESQVKGRKGIKSTAVAAPVKKNKTTLDGKVVKHVGKVSANAKDWLSEQHKESQKAGATVTDDEDDYDASKDNAGTMKDSMNRASEVQPGNTLLLDVPLGLEDSIERLLHAAALRCYIPDFFRGATESLAQQQQEQWKAAQRAQRRKRRFEKEKKRLLNGGFIDIANKLSLDDEQFDSDGKEEQEQDEYDELSDTPTDDDLERQYNNKQLQRKKFIQQFPQAKNLDPNYAYCVFVALPLGLAKIRYEQECKKWAQPYINQMRIKGLHLLKDVLPVSKFMSCMVNVQTPRKLRNKSIDLCLDLKHMGSAAWGNHTAPSIPSVISSSPQKRVQNRSRSTSPNHLLITQGGHNADSDQRIHFADSPNTMDTKAMNTSDGTFRANLDRVEDIDGTMNQLAERNAILAKQSEEIARETKAQSQAKELLQSILENPEADWSKLSAPIDDFFIQAAFLIVPHMHHHPATEQVAFEDRNPNIIKTVSEMSNEAFKAYAMELYSLQNEQDREDFVRARFRSAVILTTPFTLYLKNRGILIVEDLLRVNLHDLAMPPALLFQLEVLITIVVGRQVHAKILPTATKSHANDVKQKKQQPVVMKSTFSTSGTGADFAVPLFYDTRFQRTPLDPFGRPPILIAAKGGASSSAQKKLRSLDKQKAKISRSITQFERVTSQAALEQDLHKSPSLFSSNDDEFASLLDSNKNFVTIVKDDDCQDSDGDTIVAPSPTAVAVHAGGPRRLASADGLTTDSYLSLPGFVVSVEEDGSTVASSVAGIASPGRSHQMSATSLFSGNSSRILWHASSASAEDQVEGAATISPLNAPTQQKAMKSPTPGELPPIVNHHHVRASTSSSSTSAKNPSSSRKDFIEANRTVRPADAFKETYRCHYPGCNQVFSRNYTYKVHLKTHEIFPQYHEYKNNPQLLLDELI